MFSCTVHAPSYMRPLGLRQFHNHCSKRRFTARTTPLGAPEINLSLYLVTNSHYAKNQGELYYKIKRAIQGGVTTVQLRFPEENLQENLELAKLLAKDMQEWNSKALLIINDRVDVALAAGVMGVHLGPHDFPPADAKRLLESSSLSNGESSCIGYTVNSLEDVLHANEDESIDYIGAQVYPSKYSRNQSPKIWGLDGIKEVRSISKKPLVVIGGINEKNVVEVLEVLKPGDGVAIVRDILMYEDTFEIAQRLRGIIDLHLRTQTIKE